MTFKCCYELIIVTLQLVTLVRSGRSRNDFKYETERNT